MNYKQLQALAKILRNQGLISKKFKLTQKANVLKAEIERVAAIYLHTAITVTV